MTESLEERLAKAAQSLDLGAERYARKQTTLGGAPHDQRRRARSVTRAVLAVGSIAAATALAVGLSSTDRRPSRIKEPSEIASVGQFSRQVLRSVGDVTITLPGVPAGQVGQPAKLSNGLANLDDGSTVVVTDADLIDDVNGDGVQDAVLLVTLFDQSESSVEGSAQSSIHVVTLPNRGTSGGTEPSREIARTLDYYAADTLYASPPAPAFTGIIQISQIRATKSCCQADLQFTDFAYADGVLSPSGSRTLTRSQLGDVADQFHEIKFFVGTDSGIVDLTENEATGWFWAKAGQTLTITSNNKTFLPDGKSRFRRAIVVRLKDPQAPVEVLSKGTQPANVASNKSQPSKDQASKDQTSKDQASQDQPSQVPAVVGEGVLPDVITFELPFSARYQLFAAASGDPSGFVDATSGESTITLTIR